MQKDTCFTHGPQTGAADISVLPTHPVESGLGLGSWDDVLEKLRLPHGQLVCASVTEPGGGAGRCAQWPIKTEIRKQ
jgi:hypothetical protein